MTMTALSYWKHVKTGGVYAVLGVAVEEATLRPVVLYRKAGDAHATIFTRPAAEFMDGRLAPSDARPFVEPVVPRRNTMAADPDCHGEPEIPLTEKTLP